MAEKRKVRMNYRCPCGEIGSDHTWGHTGIVASIRVASGSRWRVCGNHLANYKRVNQNGHYKIKMFKRRERQQQKAPGERPEKA